MARPVVLTNLLFTYVALLVLLLIGLIIFFYPFDSAAKILAFLALIFGSNVVGALVVAVIQTKLASKESIWLQPVSARTTTVLVDSVVLVFLCGIALLLFALLKAKGSTSTVSASILVLLVGAAIGRYFQKRLSSKSLLPYGISFFGALVVILAGLAATKIVG